MAWNTVGRSKIFKNLGARWDVYPEPGKKKMVDISICSTFFFLEFLERVHAKDMFELFGCIGETVEVVIPPKRNRFRKRFGFARYMDMEDERVFAVKMDNIIMDVKKIHANKPRFTRGELGMPKKGEFGDKPQFISKNTVGVVKVNRSGVKGKKDTRSFAEVVLGSGGFSSNNVFGQLEYASKEEDLAKFNKAYVGVVVDPGMSYNIQNSFELEGYFSIKVTPIGANLCLLEEFEEGVTRDLIEEGRNWWSQWFSEIRR